MPDPDQEKTSDLDPTHEKTLDLDPTLGKTSNPDPNRHFDQDWSVYRTDSLKNAGSR